MRDTQKERFYRAEQAWRAAIGDKGFTSKIGYFMFVERVERDKWFRRHYGRRHYGRRHFTVKPGGWGQTAAHASGYATISLPRWARTPGVILHEIAHCCRWGYDEPFHGWQYAACYLDLVRHFMGAECERKLRATFKAHRVRYRRPRVMSPAQRAAFERCRAKSPLRLTVAALEAPGSPSPS